MHESLDEFKFRQICNKVTALTDVRVEFLLNILKTNRPIELRPLIYVRIRFLLNILRTNRQIETNFVYTLSLRRSTLVS